MKLTFNESLGIMVLLTVLAGVIFVAVQPSKRFKEARDEKRRDAIQIILEAVKADQIANGGSYLESVAMSPTDAASMIGLAATGCSTGCNAIVTQDACVNLTELVAEGHLQGVPIDPTIGIADKTGYYLIRTATGSLVVGACQPEATAVLSGSR